MTCNLFPVLIGAGIGAVILFIAFVMESRR